MYNLYIEHNGKLTPAIINEFVYEFSVYADIARIKRHDNHLQVTCYGNPPEDIRPITQLVADVVGEKRLGTVTMNR